MAMSKVSICLVDMTKMVIWVRTRYTRRAPRSWKAFIALAWTTSRVMEPIRGLERGGMAARERTSRKPRGRYCWDHRRFLDGPF